MLPRSTYRSLTDSHERKTDWWVLDTAKAKMKINVESEEKKQIKKENPISKSTII